MIISFTTVVAAAAGMLLGAVSLAVAAVFVARNAVCQARDARSSAGTSTLRLAEMEAALANATAQTGVAAR